MEFGVLHMGCLQRAWPLGGVAHCICGGLCRGWRSERSDRWLLLGRQSLRPPRLAWIIRSVRFLSMEGCCPDFSWDRCLLMVHVLAKMSLL